jgi:hypothetical protein
MYICPTCNRFFNKEDILVKHMSKCWKDKNPHIHSKSAPRSEDVNIRKDNIDILNFFNSFK